jgi:hypothetical protein
MFLRFMPHFMDSAGIIPRQQSLLCHYFTGSIYCHSYSWQLGKLKTWCRYMFRFPTKLKYYLRTVFINHWRKFISLMVLWVSNKKNKFSEPCIKPSEVSASTMTFLYISYGNNACDIFGERQQTCIMNHLAFYTKVWLQHSFLTSYIVI